jgi:hypothetical protein
MVAECKKYDKNYISVVAVTSKRATFIVVANIACIKIIV